MDDVVNIMKCFLISLCAVVLALSFIGCQDQRQNESMKPSEQYYASFFTNDEESLGKLLTVEYSLETLSAFFAGRYANDVERNGCLMWSEVNQVFPIEVVRSHGYSVYRVKEGGYFYVFWSRPVVNGAYSTEEEPAVFFAAHLRFIRDASIFDAIKPGVSTAKDVMQMDSSAEFNFLMGRGVCSYSILNSETVVEVAYENSPDQETYDKMIVKEIDVIERHSSPTRFSAVFTKDLPFSQNS